MKGTATLTLNETYNQRKAFLLSCVVIGRRLIKTLSANIDKYPHLDELVRESIEQNQQYINDQLAELTELERWRIKKGLGKDEPYKYQDIRKRTSTV